jgi:hypothetical protein
MPFDHGLDLGLFVSGDDEEPERVLPHRVEGSPVDLDRDHAAPLRALAKERQPLLGAADALFELCDVDVDLADERFVANCALFPMRHESFDAMPACRDLLAPSGGYLPGEEIIGANAQRFRVVDVVAFDEEDDSPFVGLLQVEAA